jgi:VanZ family protein
VIRNRWILVGVLLAVMAGLTAVQQLLPRPANTLWWHVVFDAGHVPLFGLFSLATLGLSISLVRRPREHHLRHYVFAFSVTAVAGCLIELIQLVTPTRTAAFLDVARNVAGSAAFLVLAATFDPLVAQATSRSKRTLLRLASALLIAVSLTSVGITTAAIVRRNAVFPRLSELDTRLGRYLVDTINAELETAPSPEPGAPAARITFLPGGPSILALRAPYPDWSGYERLELEFFSDLDRPVKLSLKVQDQVRIPPRGHIFTETLTIEPGANPIRIPLSRVRRLASGREMKMTHIHRIALKAEGPDAMFSVWMGDLRLE